MIFFISFVFLIIVIAYLVTAEAGFTFVSQHSLLVSVRPLLTVLGLLAGRARAMSPGDILFLLGLGLHLVLFLARSPTPSERDAVHKNILEV